MPHSHSARAPAWTHAEPRARTCAVMWTYVRVRDLTSARVDVRARAWTYAHAKLNVVDTARLRLYCVYVYA